MSLKDLKGMQSHALLFKGLRALQRDVICVATGCEWVKECAVNVVKCDKRRETVLCISKSAQCVGAYGTKYPTQRY